MLQVKAAGARKFSSDQETSECPNSNKQSRNALRIKNKAPSATVTRRISGRTLAIFPYIQLMHFTQY